MDDHKHSTTGLTGWLQARGYGRDYRLSPLAGGDINDTSLLQTDSGQRFCLKRNPNAPADFFAAEAAGLQAMEAGGQLRVPEVLAVGKDFILLEYIEPGQRRSHYWAALGAGLATMHRACGMEFGFERDNYCGLTPQPNPPSRDGYQFFAEQRLLYQGRLARDRGLLSKEELQQLEALAAALPRWIPPQAPALLHGDLWSGNIHVDDAGGPVLIDPAAYWGWPEADIAMTRLFGGFAPPFYENYLAVNPLESGWQERLPLYNLYHLLNHLNLFGSGYHGQVLAVLRRFGG